jgi:hypothetical protein
MKALLLSAVTLGLVAVVAPRAAAPIRVMLLDGESGGPYHNWRMTTRVLKKELDETALFAVDIVTEVINRAEQGLDAAVSQGIGKVVVQPANLTAAAVA